MLSHQNDRDHFDSLCLLRELYAQRGHLDRDVSLSIGAAVVYGEGLLRIARRRDERAARRNQATPTD